MPEGDEEVIEAAKAEVAALTPEEEDEESLGGEEIAMEEEEEGGWWSSPAWSDGLPLGSISIRVGDEEEEDVERRRVHWQGHR